MNNKLRGLKETGGLGRRRYWACINMLMWEEVIEGEVEVHPRDMGWEGMAEEMFRLQKISRGETYVYDELMALRDGAQSKDNEGGQEDGGRDYEEEAGTGAAALAGVGAQVMQGEYMLSRPLVSSEEGNDAEEADEEGGESQDGESAAQLEKGMLC